jgi:hypothetical protein
MNKLKDQKGDLFIQNNHFHCKKILPKNKNLRKLIQKLLLLFIQQTKMINKHLWIIENKK